MTEPNGYEDDSQDEEGPKFGRLLIVLILAVLFCAGLTWLMGAIFPNFGVTS